MISQERLDAFRAGVEAVPSVGDSVAPIKGPWIGWDLIVEEVDDEQVYLYFGGWHHHRDVIPGKGESCPNCTGRECPNHRGVYGWWRVD